MAILVLKTAPNHQNSDQNSDQNGPSPNFCLKNVNSQDSGQPLSENFDGLSLTGAEIFAFEICLEYRTNFEDKNSVFTRFMYLMMLISAGKN